jgi:hypothetical protein
MHALKGCDFAVPRPEAGVWMILEVGRVAWEAAAPVQVRRSRADKNGAFSEVNTSDLK